MANRKNYYNLPDYKTVTEDLDTYINAWREMAEPVEKALSLKLTGYDPNFIFTKGNPQGESTSVILPVWLVRDLVLALRG